MESIREINSIEKSTLEYLIKQARLSLPKEWSHNLLVKKMNDGEMGSFLIFKSRSDASIERRFGKQASEYQFLDEDGIPVLVTLNLDEQNTPFEVDVWKADYSPVLNFKVPD